MQLPSPGLARAPSFCCLSYGSLGAGDARLPVPATALVRSPLAIEGGPAALSMENTAGARDLALCGVRGSTLVSQAVKRGAWGRGCTRYLSLGELHGVGQQEPVDVLRAGRRGEGAPVAVVVAEVLGQHVLDVKAAQNGALS